MLLLRYVLGLQIIGAYSAAQPPFRFVATLHTQQPPVAERRGYHFVLAHPELSDIVYGCGISGELTIAKVATGSLTAVNTTVSPQLLQSRALLWHQQQLIVSNFLNSSRFISNKS